MSEFVLEKTIPKNDAYDIIVVGGGPAGCAAAAQAARGGAKVLLIEATGCLGGMGTMGMVPAWCPMTDGERVIYAGIAEEVYDRACALYPHELHGKDWTPIEPESLKRAYDELLEGAGVDVLFCSVLSDVKAADGHVEAIIVSNKSGLCAYSAKTYIDATGDGDLAAWAGAQFCLGDETTHETQLATLCFSVANVKEQIYRDMPDLHDGNNPNSPIKQWAEGDEFPHIIDKHFCQNLTTRGVVGADTPSRCQNIVEPLWRKASVRYAVGLALAVARLPLVAFLCRDFAFAALFRMDINIVAAAADFVVKAAPRVVILRV